MKIKLKNAGICFIKTIKEHPFAIIMWFISLCLLTALIANCIEELVFRLSYELKEIGNYDTYLYYTVGRALSEGKQPYLEMYENKPPMIYLLSAISYKLFGNFYLTNICSFLSFLTMLIVPIVFCIISWKNHKTNLILGVLTLIFTLATSLLFMFFSEEKSGEVQIEAFGTACLLLSMLFCYLIDLKKPAKFYSVWVVLCGVFVGIATMFKEPFALVGAVVLLMFSHNKRDLLYRIIFPAVWALVTYVIILLLSNCFVPYFTIYLKNMFSSHISIYGSPFERFKNLKIIFDYLYNFSKIIPLLIVVFFITFAFKETLAHYSDNGIINVFCKFSGVIKAVLLLYTVSFVVGLGGQYYNHHHVFAMPFYFALLMIFAESLLSLKTERMAFKEIKQGFLTHKSENKKTESELFSKKVLKNFFAYFALILLIIVQCDAFTKTEDYVYGTDWVIETSKMTKVNAGYIDDILDATGENTYLWIGFNGYNPYAYTKHLPSGPCFAQDENNFKDENNFFVTSFLSQLESVNIVVMKNNQFELGVISDKVRDYVFENFCVQQPDCVINTEINKPETFSHIILYRNNIFQ